MMLTMVLAAKDYEREDLPTVFRPVRLQLLADKAISDGLAEIRAQHGFGGIYQSKKQGEARAKVQFGGIDEKEGQRGKSKPGHSEGTKKAKPEDRAKMLLAHHYDTAFGSAKEAGKACNRIENRYENLRRAEKGLPKRRSSTLSPSTSQNVFNEHCKLVQG